MPPSSHSDELFEAFFDLALTGGVVYDPVRDAAGEVVDFTFARLNTLAQQVLRLPAQVSATYLEQFPAARATGAFEFHCMALASAEPRYFEQHYQADGYDLYVRIAARRVGQQLLVSFTDTSAQSHIAVEQTLDASRAREQVALAEIEAERLRLHQVLMRMPACISLLRGPEHRYNLVNREYERLFPGRPLLGRTIREVIPEIEDQGFYELFDRVYQTGEPYYHPEAEAWADFAGTGELQRRYYRTTFEPIRNADGQVVEVLNFAVDVTAQVEARQQVEQLNQELTAARAEAERQRGELWRVFEQAPIAIAVYRGPTYTIELANPTVCRLWGRRAEDIVGLGLFEALPEVAGMGYEELLDGVMATGQPVVMHGMEAQHDRNGRRETVYWDFVYEPMREEDGRIYGAMVVANEVTEQVEARHQLEQLNQQLEARVLERTQQLQEQQQLLSHILGQVPAAIATLSGPEHRFSFANSLYREIVAGRADLGRTVAEVQPEMAEQGYLTILDRVYATGEPFVGQEQSVQLRNSPTADEVQQLYVDFVYQPLRDAQGHTRGILTFAVDVTDKVLARQQAEAMQAAMLAAAQHQVQQREELYQVFEQAPAAIMLLREPNHRIEYVNPAYQRFFPGVELRGRLLAEAHPRAAAAGIVARFDQVYETGETYVGEELPLQLRFGPDQRPETRYFNYTYQPYREAERTVGVSVFAYDVTEQVLARRAAARRLHTQQAELRRIFEQAPVGIYLMRGPEFVIELINETAADMWGTVPATMLGRSWLDIAPGLAGSELLAAWQRMLQTGEPYYQHEVHYKLHRAERGKSDAGYFNVAYQPWRDEQNQLAGIIAVGIEVTEQVRARQQVQNLNEELQATNQELHATNRQLTRTNTDLDTFVYTASHDLKAPITNIEGLLSALRDYLPPHADPDQLVPRLLGMMENSVARFQQTIGHLTEVSRLQDAAEPAEALPLARLIEDVRLDLAPLLEATRGQLLLDLDGCPTVYFSPKNLRSILYNLLSNALKYRAPDRAPLVRLRAHCPDSQVVLEVRDNGLGLSAEQQTKLFMLFRRLHTHVDGSGVGLYMLKRIVENAGGTIAVRSEPGVGSTFTVTLPHAQPQP